MGEVIELHPPRPPGAWFACEYPERPYDPETTCHDLRCHRCRIAAQATLATVGDLAIPGRDTVTGQSEVRSLSSALALAEERWGSDL